MRETSIRANADRPGAGTRPGALKIEDRRLQLNGPLDQLDRLGKIAGCADEHAQQMQRIGLGWILTDDLPVERIGFDQLSALVISHRQRQRILCRK